MNGGAVPVRDTSISARTVWFTIVLSSAAILAFLFPNTHPSTSAANFSRKNPAPRDARFPAFIKWLFSTTGGVLRRSNRVNRNSPIRSSSSQIPARKTEHSSIMLKSATSWNDSTCKRGNLGVETFHYYRWELCILAPLCFVFASGGAAARPLRCSEHNLPGGCNDAHT